MGYEELKEEAANCAIVPGWFHRLLHSRLYAGLSTRGEVYSALRGLLADAALFQKIYALKFRGDTAAEAIASLNRLVSLAWLIDENDIRNELREIFNKLKLKIKGCLPKALAALPPG